MSIILIVLAAAAQQAASPPAQSQSTGKKSDSDRVNCQKVEETGSRVGGTKVCMTKLQWEYQRKQMREAAEAQQTGRH